MCGDSRESETVAVLVNGSKADMVFTDPPYNVDYQGYTKEKLKMENDNMAYEDFIDLIEKAVLNIGLSIKKKAGLYICHSSRFAKDLEISLQKCGFEVRNQIIWAKNTFAWGGGRYKYKHEPIFFAHFQGESDLWYGDKTQSTLWEVNKPKASKLHPTMKPIELILFAINNSSKRGDLVLDLFLGAGSTTIACEQTGRICYGMEWDPVYASIAIKRWEDFTGRKAELIV